MTTESTEKCTDRRRANLRPPWTPGTSGNPRGRRRGSVNITSAMKRVLREVVAEHPEKRTRAEELARALIDLAATGNTQAIKEILARVDGPVPTVLEGGDPEKPLSVVFLPAKEEPPE